MTTKHRLELVEPPAIGDRCPRGVAAEDAIVLHDMLSAAPATVVWLLLLSLNDDPEHELMQRHGEAVLELARTVRGMLPASDQAVRTCAECLVIGGFLDVPQPAFGLATLAWLTGAATKRMILDSTLHGDN